MVRSGLDARITLGHYFIVLLSKVMTSVNMDSRLGTFGTGFDPTCSAVAYVRSSSEWIPAERCSCCNLHFCSTSQCEGPAVAISNLENPRAYFLLVLVANIRRYISTAGSLPWPFSRGCQTYWEACQKCGVLRSSLRPAYAWAVAVEGILTLGEGAQEQAQPPSAPSAGAVTGQPANMSQPSF